MSADALAVEGLNIRIGRYHEMKSFTSLANPCNKTIMPKHALGVHNLDACA